MQPLISVIVPIYRVELYLRQCVNSILAQTYQNLELILVDDGSPDNCGLICDEYAKKDSRVRVIHKENSGVSAARNAGLEAARGKYIGFVDSDDWIAPDMYQCLCDAAEQYGAEIAVCEYYNCWGWSSSGPHSHAVRTYRGREGMEALLSLEIANYAWNKLYRRELWKDVRYPTDKLFEDVRTTYKVVEKCETIVSIPEAKYYYRRHNASITGSTKLINLAQAVLARMEKFDDVADRYPGQRDFMLKNIYEFIPPLQKAICAQDKAAYQANREDLAAITDFLRRHNQEMVAAMGFGRLGKLSCRYLCRGDRKGWFLFARVQSISSLKGKILASGPVDRVLGRAERIITTLGKMTYYYKYCMRLPLRKALFIESRGGEDLAGNLFQIAQEACSQGLKVYLSVRPEHLDKVGAILKTGQFPGLKVVVRGSRAYYKALGTSRYWITDMSLDYDAVKRPGQVFVNTWHGTPLKLLEFDLKDQRHIMGGGPRDHLKCDYLAVPSRFLFEVLLSSSHTEPLFSGKALYCGYPRNSIFFDTDQRQKVRGEKGLDGKEVFAYLPTWRDPSPAEIYQEYSMERILDFFEAQLGKDQVLFVKLHNFSAEEIDYSRYQKVRPFPADVDTYTMLNAADCLITDYSSVFFDYASTGKKVVLFAYDHEQYLRARGLYFTLDEMPFPKAYTYEEMAKELNTVKTYDDTAFLQKFCTYDCPDAARKLLDTVVRGKDACPTESAVHNGKKNILLYDASPTARLLDDSEVRQVLASLDPNEANYFYGYRQAVFKKTPAYIRDLPQGIRVITLTLGITYTFGEKLRAKLFGDKPSKALARREARRQFGGQRFDEIRILGENKYDPFCQVLQTLAR